MLYIKQTPLPHPPLPGERITKNIFWFTLVELIVVVTILAILATIWFVSYSSYLTWVRDTNRLAQLVSISDWLELYSTKNNLPLPDDNVEVQANGTTIAYQGYSWANTLETIDFTKWWKDPRDDQYFSYYLTKDRKYFQLMWFLEESVDISTRNTLNLATKPHPNSLLLGEGIIGTTHAVDYEERIPSVYGKKLWILTDTDNTPIQEISGIASVGLLNLTSGTTWYTAHLTDSSTLSWSSLLSINPKSSCKRIKQMKGWSQDGVYEINPTGVEDAEFEVYCDMTTDWGGWTFFMHVDDETRNWPYFETPTGTYDTARGAAWSIYSLSSDIFSHTEMMVTLDNADPIIAEENSKILFYKYEQWHSGFNTWPWPCSWLTWYSYKIKIWWSYTWWGTTNLCGGAWYSRTAGNSAYLTMFYTNTYWNYWWTGMWWPNGWGHFGWWYLR